MLLILGVVRPHTVHGLRAPSVELDALVLGVRLRNADRCGDAGELLVDGDHESGRDARVEVGVDPVFIQLTGMRHESLL